MEGSSTAAIQPLHGYTGELSISDGELLHLRKRTYDPTTGRFLQPDTFDGLITDPATLNRYMYAANNPLKFRDPSGNVFVFFDGTWNHDDASKLRRGTSFTNVVRMRDGVRDVLTSRYVYQRGIGNAADAPSGQAETWPGITGYGLEKILRTALDRVISNYSEAPNVFVTGFSRGSTTALAFAHALQRELPEHTIRGMFLYDTVASIGIPGNGINPGVNTSLASNVRYAYHAISFEEDRTSFPLTNVHSNSKRVTQKAFWGMHGDVGGGYAHNQILSYHTLWWMSDRVISKHPDFPNLGRQCIQCSQLDSHFPHDEWVYFKNFGRSLSGIYRSTTEHPMPGVLAMSFFLDDIDVDGVGVDRFTYVFDQSLYLVHYAASTYLLSVPLTFIPYFGVAISRGYDAYHLAALYFSYIYGFINRI